MQFWYLEHFRHNFPFWSMFYWKSVNLKVRPFLWRHCDVIRWCLYLFWYVWKEKTHNYTIVSIRHIRWVQISSSPGLVTTLTLILVNNVTKRGWVRQGLSDLTLHIRQFIMSYYFTNCLFKLGNVSLCVSLFNKFSDKLSPINTSEGFFNCLIQFICRMETLGIVGKLFRDMLWWRTDASEKLRIMWTTFYVLHWSKQCVTILQWKRMSRWLWSYSILNLCIYMHIKSSNKKPIICKDIMMRWRCTI